MENVSSKWGGDFFLAQTADNLPGPPSLKNPVLRDREWVNSGE